MTAALLGTTTAGVVVERCGLELVSGDELRAAGDGRALGRFDRYAGSGEVASAVLVALVTEAMSAEMLCAFTAPDSLVPHLSLDVVVTAEQTAMHLDLLPRVELATHPAYVACCFEPLSETVHDLLTEPAVATTGLPLAQLACMSRWAVTCSAPSSADDALVPAAAAYRRHWLSLLTGLPAPVQAECDGTDLAGRDARFRQVLFGPDLDPVWGVLSGLVGTATAERVRRSLSGEPLLS